ncbi:MAG: DNA gyrase inhibitor YacG [bacterium]
MQDKVKCPICGKAMNKTYHPFCSKRCADIDLNRWLGGHYVIAGTEDDQEGVDTEITDCQISIHHKIH